MAEQRAVQKPLEPLAVLAEDRQQKHCR